MGKHLQTFTVETHIYANGDSGNDNNDGLTINTPVQTLQKALDLFPDRISYNSCLHLSGDFADEGTVTVKQVVDQGITFLIDGGSNTTTIAGPFTADATSTVSQLDVSGAGWTEDEYAGYWIEFTSGALLGEKRLIQYNGTELIYPVKNFSAEPDGCAFNIVAPATTFTGNTTVCVANGASGGEVLLQRLYMNVTGTQCFYTFGGLIRASHLICRTTWNPAVRFWYGAQLVLSESFRDPSTFAFNADNGIGISVVAGPVGNSYLEMHGCLGMWGEASYFNRIVLENSNLGRTSRLMRKGMRARELNIFGCRPNTSPDLGGKDLVNDSGYAPTKVTGSPRSGLTLNDSTISIDGGVEIGYHTEHGIVVDNSKVFFLGAVTGSGNTGAGLYGKNNSVVTITDGSPPTLTGTIGDVSTDETTEDATWAEIDDGLELDIAGQLNIKEV